MSIGDSPSQLFPGRSTDSLAVILVTALLCSSYSCPSPTGNLLQFISFAPSTTCNNIHHLNPTDVKILGITQVWWLCPASSNLCQGFQASLSCPLLAHSSPCSLWPLAFVLSAVAVLLGSFVMANGALLASRSLHLDLLVNCFRSPVSFYDTTPLGRIINRFSKDIDTVDAAIPHTMRMWLNCSLQVASMIVVIGYSTPFFLIVAAALSIVYFSIQVRPPSASSPPPSLSLSFTLSTCLSYIAPFLYCSLFASHFCVLFLSLSLLNNLIALIFIMSSLQHAEAHLLGARNGTVITLLSMAGSQWLLSKMSSQVYLYSRIPHPLLSSCMPLLLLRLITQELMVKELDQGMIQYVESYWTEASAGSPHNVFCGQRGWSSVFKFCFDLWLTWQRGITGCSTGVTCVFAASLHVDFCTTTLSI